MTILKMINYGLGNQLFAYSYARFIADINNDRLFFYDPGESKHGYDFLDGIGSFPLRIDKKINLLQLTFYSRGRNILHYLLMMYEFVMKRERRVNCAIERDFGKPLSNIGMIINYDTGNWNEYFDKSHKINYICGYFQFKNYVISMKDEFHELLAFSNEEKVKLYDIITLIEGRTSVCIHIRKGDYVGNVQLDVCGEDYYIRAIELISRQLVNPVFFIFTDDVPYVKSKYHFLNEYPVRFATDLLPKETTVTDELRLMGYCKHFIISNSTFSWWGQFLGRDSKKIVIAPSQWYVDEKTHCHLYEDNWTVIPI